MNNDQRRVITDNKTLRSLYHTLGPRDIILGRIALKAGEEYILTGLLEKKVRVFPSVLSQMASRSKAFQTFLFSEYMVPHTRVAHDRNDLIGIVNLYNRHDVTRVITKLDRRNAGLGINLWSSIEDVYSQATLGVLPFPVVIQPFCPRCSDIRVVSLGAYREAYRRENKYNFRNNLHFGGNSSPCEPTKEQWKLCQAVMDRGGFPYAHIDLMVAESGAVYLAEINLGGGLKGAKINPPDYKGRIDAIHNQFLRQSSDDQCVT